MTYDVLIVGGGLSALAVADALHRAGHGFTLLEARQRVGGRVLTQSTRSADYDLGPAWIWPHNRRMRSLAERFGLDLFEQHATGNLVFEDAGGAIRRDLAFATMGGALRIAGGLGKITSGLAANLPPETLRLAHRVHNLAAEPDKIKVTGTAPSGEFELHADQVVLALPPRIAAASLSFSPALDPMIRDRLARVPTWMAGQAKLVAVYDRPFWRDGGLSGDAISHHGPLVEIHDASPADAVEGGLFGFLAPGRKGDAEAMKDAALAQLARLFGPDAGAPRDVLIKDWSKDPETATNDDKADVPGHPTYQPIPPLSGDWRGRVSFAGTETARNEGGFLEGALEAAGTSVAAIEYASEGTVP
ncbi:MAG: FAD-dependent oxidoreductase [Pseudomonadota bacterium]